MYIYEVTRQLKRRPVAMPHVTLRQPQSQELSAGLVCAEVAGMAPRQAVEKQRQHRIVASVTPYATQYARLAPGLLNSESEIEKTLAEIRNLRS